MHEWWQHIDLHIDWQQFHFLRPRLLHLFEALGIIVVLLVIGAREPERWKRFIGPVLRPYLFSKGSRWSIVWPLLLLVLGGSAAILGIAGPAWKKTEIPGQKVQAVVLIVLDLTKSMTATDIPPTRLERAKLKISDFLDAHPGARAGLMAYAGTPHLVLPFTSDYSIVKMHASSLNTFEMPVPGGNTQLLLQEIDTVMRPILAPSTILLFTDEITSADAIAYTNFLNSSIHRLDVVLMSSPEGAAVPGVSKVTSKQDPAVLQQLKNAKLAVTPLTLDTTDVGGIAAQIRKNLVFESDKEKSSKDWDDMGYLLIIPAMLITLFFARKGWAVHWCLLLLVMSSCSVKSKQASWWYTPDYQAQVLYNQHDYTEAEARFKDLPHKAAAAYQAGDFETAAALFALDSSAAGAYNRGLALSKLGRFEEAADAFNTAEGLDPSLSDKVQKSMKLNQHAKYAADSSAAQFHKDTKSKKIKEDTTGGKLKERKPQSKDEELSSDTKTDKLPTHGDRNTDEVKTNIHRGQESDQMGEPGDTTKQKNDDLQNIILRKPPADPGEFLHKRFILQQKKFYPNVKPGKETW
ncbi:VWA domain-containing protein [Chitinophaga sp. sic0106]|uniref:VWA domain-containing protein n=1 Tax=Chitinophaga sp. sic0106 TaxID=2854785 RepID=UPI001C46F5AC|nr:VWA domain-containing protein [Chitinophaga sp. sic0106]MBV7529598.1 VWA domain-containing protein [Chitinophaga sp. sic0106]